MAKKNQNNCPLIAALEALLVTTNISTNRKLAIVLGVSEDLIYAWRKRRSVPSQRVLFEIAKLESRATGHDVVSMCEKWLTIAERSPMTREQIEAELYTVSRPEDLPGFADHLAEAMVPLQKLIFTLPSGTYSWLRKMVACKLSHTESAVTLKRWQEQGANSVGSCLFMCNYEDGKNERRLVSFFNGHKDLLSPNLKYVGCFVCRYQKESETLSGLQRQLKELCPTFQGYFTTQRDPLVVDCRFFNCPYRDSHHQQVIAQITQESELLRDVILKQGDAELQRRSWEWSTMVSDMDVYDHGLNLLRAYHINFDAGFVPIKSPEGIWMEVPSHT